MAAVAVGALKASFPAVCLSDKGTPDPLPRFGVTITVSNRVYFLPPSLRDCLQTYTFVCTLGGTRKYKMEETPVLDLSISTLLHWFATRLGALGLSEKTQVRLGAHSGLG